MSNKIIEGTDENFEKIVLSEGDQVTLVDFWAPWCGPCKMVAPHLESMADARADLKVVKLNVDEQKSVAAQFAIRSIPTLMLFKNGQLVATKIGALSKSDLEKWVDNNK